MGAGESTGLGRERKWLSSTTSLYVALWVASAAAWCVSYVVNPRQSGVDASIRYVGTSVSLATAIAVTLPFPASALLTFPLLAIFSVSAPPHVGYGGQIVMFALRTALVLTVCAGVFSARLRRHPLSRKALRCLTVGQLVLLLASLGVTHSFGLLPSVQHRGQRIGVRSLVVQARKLSDDSLSGTVSCPLVLKSTAFVATEAGMLYEIDLVTGRIAREIRMPMPEPAEVGLGDLVKCPDYSSPALTANSIIEPLSPDRLRVVYPFHVGIGTERGWGVTDRSWRIEAEVDLSKWGISDWGLVEGYVSLDRLIIPETPVGDCRISVLNKRLEISGPGVETVVWTKGSVDWLRTAGRYAVAVTSAREVYVIAVPQAGEDEGGADRIAGVDGSPAAVPGDASTLPHARLMGSTEVPGQVSSSPGQAVSPDGKHVLATVSSDAGEQLVLLPLREETLGLIEIDSVDREWLTQWYFSFNPIGWLSNTEFLYAKVGCGSKVPECRRARRPGKSVGCRRVAGPQAVQREAQAPESDQGGSPLPVRLINRSNAFSAGLPALYSMHFRGSWDWE